MDQACDLCFRKKIKCDMLKPTCSNCSLYNAECRTSLIRMKPGGRARRRVGAQEAPEEASEDPEGIKARLERIEKLLKEASQQKAPNTSANSESPHFEVDSRSMDFSGADDQIHNSAAPTWGFDAVRPSLYFGPGAAGTPLPPLYVRGLEPNRPDPRRNSDIPIPVSNKTTGYYATYRFIFR